MQTTSKGQDRKRSVARALVRRRLSAVLAYGGLALAMLSMSAALLAGFGNRSAWWDYRLAFSILRWAAWIGLAGAMSAFVGGLLAALRRHKALVAWATLGVIAGGLTFGMPLYQLQQARSLPPIHDVTTDTENPPRFVAIAPLRQNAPNPSEYGGAAVAAMQKQGYPDIAALVLPLPPRGAFERALSIARGRGWEIVAAVPQEGRIEATDTTLWFGFKDDLVIRVAAVEGGSRVDVRSVSRVGKSDVDANAKRIRRFLKELAN